MYILPGTTDNTHILHVIRHSPGILVAISSPMVNYTLGGPPRCNTSIESKL